MSFKYLVLHCLLLPLLVLSEPRVQVSCPGLSRAGSSRSEVTCEDTPVRFQLMIAIDDVGCTAAQEGPAADTSKAVPGTSAATGATGTACANCPQGYTKHTPACTAHPGSCNDDRDCCSHWCDYTTSTCKEENTPHYLRRQLKPNTLPFHQLQGPVDDASATPRRLKQKEDSMNPEAMYDALYDDANSNYCAVNSDCLSFRCVDGYCDDGISTDYVRGSGCDDNSIKVLYTLSLSLDAGVDVGVPNAATNPEHTQWAMPGEFVDVSFPGTIVINYVTESCTYNKNTYNTTCTLSTMQSFTINVATKGHQTDPSKISDDNKPAKGGNFTYIRSAVVFSNFEGGAANFNRSGFVRAVVDAVNYDRNVYQSGQAKSDQVEEFRPIPSKAVSIIVVDPKEKLVQYEVRVMNADVPAVRNRLLHAYFKFPLALRLSHYGILSHINDQPFKNVNIDSSKSFSLLPEPIAHTTLMAMKDLLGTGGIIAIIAACVVFVAASLYVIWRYFEQEGTARLQKSIAQTQSKKEKDLNAREKELNMKVLALEEERDQVLNNTKEIQLERDQMKQEAEKMEQTLKHLQSKGPERNLKELEHQLDEENKAAMKNITEQLQQENLAIRQQLIDAKAKNQKEPITLSSLLAQESIGEEALNNSIDNMVLSATMDNDEITKQLNTRKEHMMRRLKERNAQRKKNKLMEQEKQLQTSKASIHEKTKRTTVAITSLWAKVGLLDAKLQTNEQRVDELQKKAEASRKELEMETMKRTNEAHNKLEERLRKRKKKQNDNKEKKQPPHQPQKQSNRYVVESTKTYT